MSKEELDNMTNKQLIAKLKECQDMLIECTRTTGGGAKGSTAFTVLLMAAYHAVGAVRSVLATLEEEEELEIEEEEELEAAAEEKEADIEAEEKKRHSPYLSLVVAGGDLELEEEKELEAPAAEEEADIEAEKVSASPPSKELAVCCTGNAAIAPPRIHFF